MNLMVNKVFHLIADKRSLESLTRTKRHNLAALANSEAGRNASTHMVLNSILAII